MDKLSQMDLGSTILSIALSAGFVAFGALVFRLLILGVSTLLKKLKKGQPIKNESEDSNDKGFKIIK